LHLASQVRSARGNHVCERVVLSLLHSTNRKKKKAA
jgi:hypothetical protein